MIRQSRTAKYLLLVPFLMNSPVKGQNQSSPPQTRLCAGHNITGGIFIDASAANQMGDAEAAFVARWLDPSPGSRYVHTAVFTRTHCVAVDKDEIDGKYIDRIWGDFLTVSKGGFIAYEADYWDHRFEAPGTHPHRGVFIEGRFAFELNPSKFHWDSEYHRKRIDTTPDFTLTDEGRVIPNVAVMLLAPLIEPTR